MGLPWARGKFLAWDATCPDTVALSHLNSTRSQAGAAAMQAGALKIQKYNALAPSHSFVALARKVLNSCQNWEGASHLSPVTPEKQPSYFSAYPQQYNKEMPRPLPEPSHRWMRMTSKTEFIP